MRRARQRNVVRRKLTEALHQCDSLVLLREAVVNTLCDWSDVDLLDPVDSEAETERGYPESAPATDVDSALGREYGDRAPTEERRR
jgi:hypothetical protein